MAVLDPTDARLLALLAEVGRVAVHDLANRAGMDVREVAARLAGLAAGGLPLVVGVECDVAALRYALARGAAAHQVNQPSGPYGPVPPGPVAPGPGPAGPPSGPTPVAGPVGQAVHGHPVSRQPVPGQPAPGSHPGHPGHGGHTGPHGVGTGPHGVGTGPHGVGTGPHGVGAGPHTGPNHRGTGAGFGPAGSATAVPQPAGGAGGVDPVGTWGPPGSAAWARGDDLATPTVRTTPSRRATATARRAGTVGETLHTDGQDGDRLAIQLVEVVDPADFLFTAAGYRLQPGERSVVVHTEVTNRGSVPFSALPDLYLVLLDGDGNAVSKAPVALSSRPPHRMGVKPGETAGGHTVYVLPEDTEITAVRWSAQPDDAERALTWAVRPA